MDLEEKYIEEKEKIQAKLKQKDLVQLTQKQVKKVFKSKSELYNMMSYGLKAYLPTYRQCSMEFLR